MSPVRVRQEALFAAKSFLRRFCLPALCSKARSAKGSPFGRAGAKRLRGQARRERTAHAAISRLFVRAMLSLRPRITVSILALSVTFGDTARVAAPSICFGPWCGPRILLAAAPTATPCFRHWRRSSLLLPEGEALSEPERCAKNYKNPLQTFPRCGIIHLAASPLEIEYLPL